MSEKVTDSSAFSRLLGMEFLEVSSGNAVMRMMMTDDLRNRAGKLHGGALFSLIDSAMGFASKSRPEQPDSVTLECKINYIRPVSDGEVRCRAWVVHAGRRTQVIEAEVHQGEKLVAKAQATFAVL
jgi:acyl-CoA thioesterase